MRRRLRLAALLTVALPLAAQQHPNVERGFQADKVYQLNGIDNVNVYNGNLSLSIPIGTEYPGNGTLKYNLTLVYNSKNWDQEQYLYDDDTVCHPPPGSGSEPPPECGQFYVKTVPSKSSNAGMGWMLSLGRLLSSSDPELYPGPAGSVPPYWVYESPDGARHAFSLGEENNVPIVYTKDGSLLRGKAIDTDHLEVHFPDGMIHTFGSAPNNAHRLTQIRDSFGNHLDICYTTQCGGTDGDWTLSEYSATGNTPVRQHYVRFRDLTTGMTPPGNGPKLNAPDNYNTEVSSVDLAGFNGTRAVYSFEYTTDQIPYQSAGCYGDYRQGDTPDPSVPRLKTVSLPDASHWQMEYGNSGVCAALTKLVLPTGGRMEWEYIPYSLPTSACRRPLVIDGDIGEAFYSTVEGVKTKKLIYTDDQQHDVESKWTYAQEPSLLAQFPCQSGNPTQKQQQSTVSITSPDGLKTEHYFSVWNTSANPNPPNPVQNPPTYFDISEYGLPFTRSPGSGCDHAFSSGEWCLSSQVFECPSGQCASTPKRSTYVRYEGDSRYSTSGFEGYGYRREVATKTIFHDDGERSVQTERSQYDGLGHFRKVVTSDSWSGFSREEDTDYNWLKSPVTVNASDWANSPANNRPGTTEPWLLNLFDKSTVSANNTSAETDFCFNATTGFLNWKRSVTGATPANDILAAFDADNNGNVTKERYFGGDATPLTSTTIACPDSFTATPAFTLNHTYASGVRNSSQFSGLNFKTLNLTIDANTGFPSASRDPSGRQTTFEYDALGRITKVIPPGTAWTSYSYGTTETPPHASAKQNSTGSPNTPLTEKHYYYDGLGRLKQSRTHMPANWSVTTTTYDAFGRPATTSMPEYRIGSGYESFSPLHTSSYAYDLLGRVRLVTAPDMKQTTTSYAGSRLVTKTQTFNAANTNVSRREEYDGAGQLHAVTENLCESSCGADTNVRTTYNYDAAGHLTCVDMSGSDPCATGLHNRSFTYDGRGFLQTESHPENGTSAYKYDALGHVTEKTVTDGSEFDLLYDYDLAGRLRHVTRKNGLKALKALAYNDDINCQNFGKLETASSSTYNTPTGSAVTVTENYTYGDSAGRLTNKSTTISGIGSPRNVTQSYTYDDLDEVSDIAYPATTSGSPGWTHLVPQHNYGFLTRIDANNSQPSFNPPLTDITYAPSGSVNVVPHKNGVTDTYTPDSNGMARPQSIGFSGWSGGCTAPTIGAVQSSNGTSLTGGQSTNLFLSADGHGETPTYQWYLGDAAISGATLSSYTATPTQTSTYRVRVANSCGYVDSATLTITVQATAPAAPANLVAVRDSTSPNNAPRINISWQASSGATGYDVWRQSNGGWAKLTPMPINSTSYADSVAPDTAYVYYAIAVGTNGLSSGPSNKDAASSFVFAPVSSGQQILFVSFDDILQHGINRLLSATGNPTRTWHDIDNVNGADCTISAASDPNPVTHSTILAAHILALRCAMNRALTSAGVSLAAYTDPSPTNVFIQAVHINELQNRTK